MAGKANFSIIRGDTFSRSCTFRNKTSGTPINITGATISGKVVSSEGSVNLTCSILSPVAGTFKFGLSSAQTALLKTGVNAIEVQITYSDLTVQTLFNGNLIVVEQIA